MVCERFSRPPGDTAHCLEEVCARLQEAADGLDDALAVMPGGQGRADLHEAIGAIMESLRLVASAHGRLTRSNPDVPHAAE